jgi:hypothetical protein
LELERVKIETTDIENDITRKHVLITRLEEELMIIGNENLEGEEENILLENQISQQPINRQ